MICDKCKNPVPDNVKFCPHCGAPVQSMGNQLAVQEPVRSERKRSGKGLSIFAGVLAVAAACFLGIALYIFINPGSVSENGAAGDLAETNENVTAQEVTGADVAAGENDAAAGADTEAEVIADGEKSTDDGSVPGEDVPVIPILQVENVHEDADGVVSWGQFFSRN
jgi:hypothetical protein